MSKLFKSLRINNHGEVASMLTIVSFLLLAAGTILGSSIAQRETRTVSKASGENFNVCQLGACDLNFDGRTDDNGWCQASGVRCQRYNGKVCQLPDPWCDTPNQGPAATCTGANQKGTTNQATCQQTGKNCGDGRCDCPNENWETCSLDCPYQSPPITCTTSSQPPAGGNQTQCVNEGGFCSQSTDACNNTQGHAPDPTNQPKDCSGSYPICCKPWSTPPTPTPTLPPGTKTISGTVTVYFTQKTFTEITVNAEQGAMAYSPQSSSILGATTTIKSWSANDISSGQILRYTFTFQDEHSYKITASANLNIDTRAPTFKAACKGGVYTDNKDFCDDLHHGDTANFIIDFGSGQASTTDGTVSGSVLVGDSNARILELCRGKSNLYQSTGQATNGVKETSIFWTQNGTDFNLICDGSKTNNPNQCNANYSFTQIGSYKIFVRVDDNQNKRCSGNPWRPSDVLRCGPNDKIAVDIKDCPESPVAQLPPNALQFGFTAPEYKKVIDGYISGDYSALQISEWVSRATNSPGIKIKFCDPMKGECNIPF